MAERSCRTGSTAQDIRSYAALWPWQGKNLDSALAATKRTVEFADTQSKRAMQKKLEELRGPAKK